jgi:hypothetical protein
MYTRPTAPLSIGGVLDDAIKLYRGSFRSCWVVSLLGSIALALQGFYFGTKLSELGLTGARGQGAADILQALGANFRGSFLTPYLITYLVMLVVYGALFAQINSVASGSSESPGAGLLTGLRRLPGIVLISIVFAVGAGLAIVILCIPGVLLWTSQQYGLSLLLFALAFVPLIYLSGKFLYWLPAVFADKVGSVGAVGRSWVVTSGNWWRSTTIMTVAGIIVVVMDLMASYVFIALVGVMGALHRVDVGSAFLTGEIVRAMVGVFVLPMLPAAMLAIYYDLKLRREGADLAARANSLQSA